MAQIKKRINKKGGVVYSFRVSDGYDGLGKQIVHQMTWYPDPSMSARQAEREAQKQCILFEEKVKSGQFSQTNVCFRELADEYLHLVEQMNTMRLSSLQRLLSCKERTYRALGNLPVASIRYRDVQSFITSLSEPGMNQRTGGGLGTKSQVHHLTLVSNVMRYAIRCGIRETNPCQGVIVKQIPSKPHNIYTLAEEKALLAALAKDAPMKYYVFFALVIYTGMRIGEVAGLEWSDIDLSTGIMQIRRTSEYCNKSTGTFTNDPKTKASKRVLKLPVEVVNLLKQFKFQQNTDKVNLGDQWVECDRLFTKTFGEPINPNQPRNFLRKFCKAHDLPYKAVHNMRHSFATELIVGKQVDPKTISSVLGHSDTATTLKIYTHELQAANVMAIDYVADLFGHMPLTTQKTAGNDK